MITTNSIANQNFKSIVVLIFLCIGLLAMIVISLAAGRYTISISNLLNILSHSLNSNSSIKDSTDYLVLFKVRLPRMITAIFVGAALSGSGACYQVIFRNPMVEPSLLGVTAGAAFGAALGILFSAGFGIIQLMSFLFGLSAVIITSAISTFVSRTGDRTIILILCGIVTSTLFTAFLSLVKYVADPNSKLPAISYWTMGSIASVNMNEISIVGILVLTGLIPLFFLRWRINVMAFGDDEAGTLGINTTAIRSIVITLSTLMTAAVVSISGMIGWIGLVVPHLARMLVGPSFPVLLPASILLGGLFLLFVDTIARITFQIEIPLGIITAIAGAPFFVILLARGKRGWI